VQPSCLVQAVALIDVLAEIRMLLVLDSWRIAIVLVRGDQSALDVEHGEGSSLGDSCDHVGPLPPREASSQSPFGRGAARLHLAGQLGVYATCLLDDSGLRTAAELQACLTTLGYLSFVNAELRSKGDPMPERSYEERSMVRAAQEAAKGG